MVPPVAVTPEMVQWVWQVSYSSKGVTSTPLFLLYFLECIALSNA